MASRRTSNAITSPRARWRFFAGWASPPQLRNAGLPADYPNDVSYRTTATGVELARIAIPCRADRYTDRSGPDGWWPTAEPPHRINQIYLEPVLFAHAEAMPGLGILNRTELDELRAG